MSRIVALVVAVLGVASTAALGAGWGPSGHSKITWEVTQSDRFGFEIPGDVARVMAFGSIAPDMYNFSTPAAHSQTPDPALENGHLVETARVYEERQRAAYRDARDWHEFYLGAAVEAMKHGQRERAAFLLGYALHNREDFATHGGMENLRHAGLKAEGHDPDADPDRLAMARSLASIDIDRFRAAVGSDNWQLFTGHEVRKPGAVGSVVPEPLTRLGLETWDPASGTIPAPGLGGALAAGVVESMDSWQKRLENAGLVDPVALREMRGKLESTFLGFLTRQDAMMGFLDLTAFRDANGREMFPRDREFLRMPLRQDAAGLKNLALEASLFEFDVPEGIKLTDEISEAARHTLPWTWKNLRPEEKELLSRGIWNDLMRDELNEERRRLAETRTELSRVKSLRLNELREFRRDFHQAAGWAIAAKAAAARADRKKSLAATLSAGGPPRVDARPRSPSPPPGPDRETSENYAERQHGGYSERDHHVDMDGVRSRINRVLGEHGLSLPR